MLRWGRVILCFAFAGILFGVAIGAFWIVVISLAAAWMVPMVLLFRLFRPRDPYDLHALRQVHERADWGQADEVEIDKDADIVCPNCGTVYGSVLLVCPNCRASGYR